MEYKNYTAVGNSGTKKPTHTHVMIETNSSGTIYIADSANPKELIKTTDKGENWGSTLNNPVSTRYDIYTIYHDKINDFLYVSSCDRDITQTFVFWKIDLSDDTYTGLNEIASSNVADTLFSNGQLWWFFLDDEGGDLILEGWDLGDAGGNPQIHQNLGTIGVRTFDISFGIAVGTNDVYFFFKWSDENVELWKADTNADTFTEVYDFGANSDFPDAVDQYGIAYDGSNVLTLILKDTGDANKMKQWTYNISGDSATKGGEMNVAVMMDRNTVSVPEKAFHLTEYKVYELHENTSRLHLIANPNTTEIIVGITDNFFITTSGDIWEYEDLENQVIDCIISYKDMDAFSATMDILNTITIEKGMFISITDTFTTASVSATAIIFEGFVGIFTGRYLQTVELISPALKDLDEEFPSGDYSGRTDEIIVSLLSDYADYITAGTMTAGTAMGTITFAGDKSLREILDEFAMTDKFIWYLTPTGVLLYNAGTVDSGENFTETSNIWDVTKIFGERAINYVNIKGAFISGAQVSGTIAQDQEDQQIHGRVPFERTFSHLDLAAQCTTTNTNILARLGVQPLIVPFGHQDSSVGVIQVAETVTLQYNLTDPNIPSDQFGIRNVIYNAKQGKAMYRVSDSII